MKKLLFTIHLLSNFFLQAQDTHTNEFWTGYITDIKLNERISLWNDLQYASQVFVLSRHGVTYHVDSRFTVTAGYAISLASTTFTTDFVRLEHRPWAQYEIRTPIAEKLEFRHRIRYDARFREKTTASEVLDEFEFYHRIRFMNGLKIPLYTLKNGQKINLNILEEMLFKFGENITGKNFEQNRLFILVGFNIGKIHPMIGYEHRLSPLKTHGYYSHRHGLMIWIVQKFDWSKREVKN